MPIIIQGPEGRGKIPLPHVPIDEVGAQERATSFTKRSLKEQTKLDLLYQVIKMIDLTTLEGTDTEGKVKQLCHKAIRPLPAQILSQWNLVRPLKPIPSVAAVCLYPELLKYAVPLLAGTGVELASVATAFPAGQLPLATKLLDVKNAIRAGATEVDMVINRGAFLSGHYQKVFDEIVAVKELCGESVHLKVILETGELGTYDQVRRASWLAMEAGADFIKTSTGKISPAATMPVTYVMLQAIWDFYEMTGKKIGMKPAGGIRTAKLALHYLVMVKEVLGEDWMTPKLFRFGASSLLNDVLKQILKAGTGHYFDDKAFGMD